jgi:hypothetical protein
MRYLTIVLAAVLLPVSLAHSDELVPLRFQDDSGPMTLTITHDIEVREPVASRAMSFDVTLATDPAASSATLLIENARATFTAHGMEQRLSARHLNGSKTPLTLFGGGRGLVETDSTQTPLLDLGPPVSEGLSVAAMLIGVMPELPAEPVSVGTSWATERSVRLIEGWAWSSGQLKSRHRVTAIDSRGGRTIVTVESQGGAQLQSDEGDRAYSGELKRSLRWTFDATGGRVVSLSMEQESDGTTMLPQGELPVVQRTEIELKAAA